MKFLFEEFQVGPPIFFRPEVYVDITMKAAKEMLGATFRHCQG